MNESGDIINILCATDDNYAPYCGIMLTSLFESNKDCQFSVWVLLDGDMSHDNSKKYKKLERKYGHSIQLLTIDNHVLDACPINRQNDVDNHAWVTLPTYYRLLASELLPREVRKVLYLDCDVAVVSDIRPLWDVNLADKAIAGVIDCDGFKNSERLGLPQTERLGYFNAGVALYNLDYWRDNDVGERFFKYIRDNEDRLLLMDQDVVNGVLADEKCLVPERYNFQVSFFYKMFWDNYPVSLQQTLLEECGKATIIHYCGGTKPWDYAYYGSPFYAEWDRYRKLSLWSRNHLTRPFGRYIKFVLKKCFFSGSLRKKRQVIWSVLPENRHCFE